MENTIRVLLIEDNPGDRFLIQEYLKEIQSTNFVLTWVDSLARTISETQLGSSEYDIVLLDLTLPDSMGFETFKEVADHFPNIPIIILSGLIEELAVAAVQEGAQDWLAKGKFDAYTLYRSIKYAIERNNLQKKVRESEHKFRAIADNSLMGIVLLESGKIQYMNNKMEDLLGFNFEEAQKWDPYHFVKYIYPDDQYMIEAFRQDFYNPESEFTQNFILRWIKKNSQIIYCEMFMGKAPYLGEKAVLISAVDVTDQVFAKQALASEKERLSVTLSSIGDAVIATDIYGIINLMNSSAEKLTSWDQNNAIGMPLQKIFNIVYEDDDKKEVDFLDKVIETQQVYEVPDSLILKSKNGMQYLIQASAAPIKDNTSRLIGVIVVFRDTTEERRHIRELLRANKLESLGILAGGIAHDFNNILQAILGSISLARLELPANSDASRILFSAEKASVRAKALTNQLLAFAKGGVPVKKPLAIDALIKETASFALLGSKNRHNFEINPQLWVVEGDEGMISQAINNIIINADQAMPNGGTITIKAENFSSSNNQSYSHLEGNYVKIEISDEGAGIPTSILPNIFDPYFTTKPNGNGLGLSMAHTIVKNHGGIIDVESELGKGSIFTILLPASIDTKLTEEIVMLDSTLEKGRILVMDDEEAIRKILGGMLNRLGYDVDFASCGEEAIEKYANAMQTKDKYLALIMDLTVPGAMGGKEAIRKLLHIDANVKAIVSSGYSSDPIMADFSEYGFIGVLSKPYTIIELQKTLSRSLHTK